MAEFHREHHRMTRVDIATGLAYDEFVAALEKAAPPADLEQTRQITAGGGSWDEVRRVVAQNAPNELMVYAKLDAVPLFGVAGHRVRAVEYLVGNHVIAETMFRHDPKALLYAPLRMLVYSDADGNAVLTMDQPSTAFGSLSIAEVSEVGNGLDEKMVNLLRVVGVDAADAFRRADT
jgi:isopentenyl diphosphate isomerase/L-lactate dehydrogenase-like FMN-dependent dehydrogenase